MSRENFIGIRQEELYHKDRRMSRENFIGIWQVELYHKHNHMSRENFHKYMLDTE
jgi:hypothetical protein